MPALDEFLRELIAAYKAMGFNPQLVEKLEELRRLCTSMSGLIDEIEPMVGQLGGYEGAVARIVTAYDQRANADARLAVRTATVAGTVAAGAPANLQHVKADFDKLIASVTVMAVAMGQLAQARAQSAHASRTYANSIGLDGSLIVTQ